MISSTFNQGVLNPHTHSHLINPKINTQKSIKMKLNKIVENCGKYVNELFGLFIFIISDDYLGN